LPHPSPSRNNQSCCVNIERLMKPKIRSIKPIELALIALPKLSSYISIGAGELNG
jgi:hypothetical protein